MVKKGKDESCCTSFVKGIGCCKVESLVSIDERGQMILPKELRDKAKIKAGDKLAIVSWERNEKILGISLIKADDFAEMVKDILGPMMKEIIEK